MASGFWTLNVNAVGDGPTLTAAAAATCLPVTARYTFAPNVLSVGTEIRIRAWGRISCVVTTPGTARFSVLLGGVTCFDTGALNLNIVAKTTLPWRLDIDLTCRTVGAGTAATLFGFAHFGSEAYIGSPVATAGGIGDALVGLGTAGGVEGAPAVGAGFDSTVANTFDVFFTQTVATGSFTVHKLMMESATPLGA